MKRDNGILSSSKLLYEYHCHKAQIVVVRISSPFQGTDFLTGPWLHSQEEPTLSG